MDASTPPVPAASVLAAEFQRVGEAAGGSMFAPAAAVLAAGRSPSVPRYASAARLASPRTSLTSPRTVSSTVYLQQQVIPTAAVSADINGDGIADITYIGADRNKDGIPDVLESAPAPRAARILEPSATSFPVQVSGPPALPVQTTTTTSLPAQVIPWQAQAAQYTQAAQYRWISPAASYTMPVQRLASAPVNLEAGVSDVQASIPVAAAPIDTNGDGIADATYVGVDLDRDGIPDALEATTVHKPASSLDAVEQTVEKRLESLEQKVDAMLNIVAGQGRKNDSIIELLERMSSRSDDKAMLHAIEQNISDVATKIARDHDNHAKGLHQKLDSHGRSAESISRRLDGMLDHDMMKRMHSAIEEHIGEHSSRITREISKLPLPPDQKVLLQSVENMMETVQSRVLESHGKLKDTFDDHARGLHGKLDRHGRNHEGLQKMLADLPGHESIMRGVHNLMAEHIQDHSGRISREISKIPLPPDEKVMLQAIENMEEAVLGKTLEAISTLKAGLDSHNKGLHGKLDVHGRSNEYIARRLEGMPDHDSVMRGLHGIMAEHISEHCSKVMCSINKLPIPADEKLMLKAIEGMCDTILGKTLDAVGQVKLEVDRVSRKQRDFNTEEALATFKYDLKVQSEKLNGQFMDELNFLLKAMQSSWEGLRYDLVDCSWEMMQSSHRGRAPGR